MSATNRFVISILIPTIPERWQKFETLTKEIKRQIKETFNVHPTLGTCEINSLSTPKFTDGGLSIGEKRQKLIEAARGKYLCFLDDDESVSPNYVETLLRLVYADDPDVVTFRSIAKMDNFWTVVDMSLQYKRNQQATPNDIVRRPPWHICPVRSEFAKQEVFNKSNYGEDWDWFKRVLKKCKKEIKSKAVIHQYNHSVKSSRADNVTTSVG